MEMRCVLWSLLLLILLKWHRPITWGLTRVAEADIASESPVVATDIEEGLKWGNGGMVRVCRACRPCNVAYSLHFLSYKEIWPFTWWSPSMLKSEGTTWPDRRILIWSCILFVFSQVMSWIVGLGGRMSAAKLLLPFLVLNSFCEGKSPKSENPQAFIL